MTDLKVPPHNTDAERSVLGSIMLERNAFDIVSELLDAESFYHDSHRTIYEAMSELRSKSRTIDTLAVCDILKSRGKLEQIGGAFEVARCVDSVVNSTYLTTHARIIAEKAILRMTARLGQQMTAAGYDESADPFDVIAEVEKQLFAITNKVTKGDVRRIDSTLVRTMQRIEELRHREYHLTGVPSGFQELDRITSGFQDTDLIILAARPACGKSAYALNVARNAAKFFVRKEDKVIRPYPVGIFNLEMSDIQVTNRVLSNESDTPLGRIQNARLDDAGMKRLYDFGIQKVAGMDIYLDDTASLNIYEFKAKARRMVDKFGVKLIILDYLQLMKSGGRSNQNREQEIATITRELKITAKELKVPIIALSQLSREVERRGGSPTLADLRESGAIEQDADIVIFLYRRPESEILGDASLKEDVLLKIAKHRNGELETLLYRFQGEYQRFTERGLASTGGTTQPEEAPF